ncbi:MAG TPA: ferredoxin [Chloroflexi bacterium]|nr:ferredoxin [Chloroflexota bacterium]
MQASPEVIRSISGILRENDWRVTAFVRDAELVGLAPTATQPLGFAVDLGTTKIAAYLVDLESGAELASAGAPNPQIGYGEDVISRLNFVYRNPEGGATLAGKVHDTLNEVLGNLVVQAGVTRTQVVEACIVGNTAMTHLLLQLPVAQLAKAPYVAAINEALEVRAIALGLEMAPGATVYIPPCIGGFVGADHVAMILGCDLDQSPKIALGVDIGTNTEIALRVPGTQFMTSVSCASGPAFEGAHISEGMRAAAGAIEKVRITSQGLELTTINDEPPVGLCGSGIIDLVAELHRTGLINSRGRFQKASEAVRATENSLEFQLVNAQNSGTGREIVIRQEDINEIQLAKGAIHAGLEILLAITGTAPEAVEEVIIAGAFGSFLNVENAIAMGLFPDLPQAVYRQVGNAAAIGAKWILISKTARQRAQVIQKNTRYNELTTYPKFNRAFALGMLFPEKNETVQNR